MPQMASYPDLAVWEALINIIKADSHIISKIGTTNPKTRLTEINVYNLPLTEEIIKSYPAVAVWFKADSEVDNNHVYQTKYFIDVATQNADLAEAIKNTWKLAKDIELTLKHNPNLNRSCGSHYISRYEPTDTPVLVNNLWTFMLTMTVNVFTASSYIAY